MTAVIRGIKVERAHGYHIRPDEGEGEDSTMSCPDTHRADARPELIVSAHDLSAADSPSEEIVSAIVEHVDAEPGELRPVSRYVDPDALDALFGDDAGTEITLSFRYEGYRVAVDTTGLIQLRRQDDALGAEPA